MATWDGASILVIRLSSLGDIARMLPSLRALHASRRGSVDVTVEDRFAPLLELFPLARRIVPYPRRAPGPPWRHPVRWGRAMAAYGMTLREERYDLALDLHGILRSAMVAAMSGAARTAGYGRGFGKEGSHLLYGRAVAPAASPRISRYQRYAGTLAALGLPPPTGEYLVPRIPPHVEAEVSRFLSGAGLDRRPFLFAFLGTSKAQAHKRWPVERFLELARLARRRDGLPTLLGWGPEEAELVRGLPVQDGLAVVPDWDLPHLLDVVRRSAAFVGADTGAMHLAALMGVPTVAVLGPTDPVLNAPFGSRTRMVHREGIRKACPGEGCTHGDCMGAIGAGEVMEALGEVIGSGN